MSIDLEEGQIVSLRHKVWAVHNVVPVRAGGEEIHKVNVECLSDHGLGRTMDVIWEREVAPRILEVRALPPVDGLDKPETFQAFLAALRWSCSSLADGASLQAPFRGGVQIEEYQLAPVVRSLTMPSVRLLIADDVGLGKTIEAGLVAQEMIHTHRASRIMILCPAHLQIKWRDEMIEKFGLDFRIIDRDSVQHLRREYGTTINPWASFPRLIASIDYLKREHPRRLFEELFDRRQQGALKPWDLLILDEAHNVAPSGRRNYVRDSDRTALLRGIARQFEHRIFLTATPHNGYRESFTGLLELLDELRFSRGTELNREHLNAVTIRRLKDELRYPDGRRRFPQRRVLPTDEQSHPDLYVTLAPHERDLFNLLEAYSGSRQKAATKANERATQFVLTLLKKRALSSPLALRETLVTHSGTVGVRQELGIGDSLFRTLEAREEEDWSDDEEKEDATTAALEEASSFFPPLNDKEKQQLSRLYQIADDLRRGPDSKAQALLNWITTHLKTGDLWNGERVIIFTEYRHTLDYLQSILTDAGMGSRLVNIYGGMSDKERQEAHRLFLTGPEETDIRILLATDAASEGADFQLYCRNMIHYEIPWNPVRMEQRNGRVDRHGQPADEVRIHHFVYRNHEDSEFLKKIVEKVEAIRTDLGSVGAIVTEQVRAHALGRKVNLDEIDTDPRRALAQSQFRIDNDLTAQTKELVQALNQARVNLGISEQTQYAVLREALLAEGLANLTEPEEHIFRVTAVPAAWRDCYRYVSRDGFERPLTFDRQLPHSRGVEVLHLDHPLMKRAIATLRAQMWKSVQTGRDVRLHRVTAVAVPRSLLRAPAAVAWGRLLLLGPARNRLHEGLIHVGAELNTSLGVLTPDLVGLLLAHAAQPAELTVGGAAALIEPYRDSLQSLLQTAALDQAAELTQTLASRGEVVRLQVRNLITERMADIRKRVGEIKKEEDLGFRQLSLFEDERQQLADDVHMLRKRLEELNQERDAESIRLSRLYQVTERRIYPLALQLFVPVED